MAICACFTHRFCFVTNQTVFSSVLDFHNQIFWPESQEAEFAFCRTCEKKATVHTWMLLLTHMLFELCLNKMVFVHILKKFKCSQCCLNASNLLLSPAAQRLWHPHFITFQTQSIDCECQQGNNWLVRRQWFSTMRMVAKTSGRKCCEEFCMEFCMVVWSEKDLDSCH